MCISAYEQYSPRPVRPLAYAGPTGTEPTPADLDPELYGPRLIPPGWYASNDGAEPMARPASAGASAPAESSPPAAKSSVPVASSSTGAVQGTIVTLGDGKRLLIVPLD
jgi:hypothetical protein